MSQKNTCIDHEYSNNVDKTDIEKIFVKADSFSKVTIDPNLLVHMQTIVRESRKHNFESYREYDKFMIKMRKKIQYNIIVSKTILFAHYRIIVENKLVKRNYQLEKFMRIKGARSRSGVVSVTVFTAGSIMGSDNKELIGRGGCPQDCHYCPFEKDDKGNPTQPRSYLSTEPGNKRATENKHHPYSQTISRLYQLESIGHISNNANDSNKIELIISGGTFNFYPTKYIEWFATCVYYGCNTYYEAKENKVDFNKVRPMKTLQEEKNINETSPNRVIGLTIESRPDWITPKHKKDLASIDFSQLELYRSIGVTRVQIGIQSTNDHILKKINRGCTNEDNIIGIRRLKQNGFKTDIHIMLDLPGSSPEMDKMIIDEITSREEYQADQWKLYPTEVTPFTKIKEWYDQGSYIPYSDDHTNGTSYKMLDVLMYGLTKVPPYIRINRVVRDIPHISIEGGLKCSNMRQLASNRMKKKQIPCHDIRNREVKFKTIDPDDMLLDIITYPSSSGTEYFIQYCSNDKMTLYGFIRLRLNKENNDVMPCLRECALIRELHVYGQHTGVGSSNTQSVQHKGLGSRLLQKAEDIAYTNGYNKIAVISGVGVRDYYRKKGYVLGTHEYMYKPLYSTCTILTTISVRMFIALCMIIVSCMCVYIELM